MEKSQVNNIHKIKDAEVDYYVIFDQKLQFDEMIEVIVDLDPNDRNYSKQIALYPDGRIPIIMTIDKLYEGLKKHEFKHPQVPEVKGYNSYVDENSIRKTRGIYRPKSLLLLCDELNELMNSENYRAVDSIKQAIGSIARLGRA